MDLIGCIDFVTFYHTALEVITNLFSERCALVCVCFKEIGTFSIFPVLYQTTGNFKETIELNEIYQ